MYNIIKAKLRIQKFQRQKIRKTDLFWIGEIFKTLSKQPLFYFYSREESDKKIKTKKDAGERDKFTW